MVSTTKQFFSDLIYGQQTVSVAGTAVILTSVTTTATITVRAHDNNTGNIYVGDSSVSSANGYILSEGETVSFDVNHASINICIDADTGGDGVSFIGAV